MNPIKSHGMPSDGLSDFSAHSVRSGHDNGMLMRLEAGEFRVLSQGSANFNGAQYPVAWVQGDAEDSAVLLQALTRTYGERLSAAVAQDFGLTSGSAAVVPHAVAREAVVAADLGHQALAGVDFLTRLEVSALRNGPEFRRVCAQMGISRASLSRQRFSKSTTL